MVLKSMSYCSFLTCLNSVSYLIVVAASKGLKSFDKLLMRHRLRHSFSTLSKGIENEKIKRTQKDEKRQFTNQKAYWKNKICSADS